MKRHIVIGVLLATILLSNATCVSAAPLWDLILKVNLEQAEIVLYKKPVVFGTVLDHAAKPVSGAEVSIRFSDKTASTTTDSQGNFRYEFGEQYVPGTFSVIVSAKMADKKGFTTLTLKVGKEDTTFNEMYYNSNGFSGNKTILQNDPYAELKLKNYQKFIAEQNKIKQRQLAVESKKLALQEQRNATKQKIDETIKERQIGAGIFTDDKQQKYLSKVDPRVKDAISAQLNYTKQLFAEAQYAMKSVLDNGGSLQEAKKAYFEKLSVTKDQLINTVDLNNTENHSKIKDTTKKINSKKVKGLSANKNLK